MTCCRHTVDDHSPAGCTWCACRVTRATHHAAAEVDALEDWRRLGGKLARWTTDAAWTTPPADASRPAPVAGEIVEATAVARMARRGRPPTAAAAVRRSQAAAIVAAEPGISGSELARRIGVSSARGGRILAEIRASLPDLPDVPPPPIADRVVRLTGVQVDRLAAFPGETTRDQLDIVLGIAEQNRAAGRKEDE